MLFANNSDKKFKMDHLTRNGRFSVNPKHSNTTTTSK